MFVFDYSEPDVNASIVQELFSLLIEMLFPATKLILSRLLLLKSVIDVFNEPILFERLFNEVLRFVILLFVIVLLGIINVDVFKFDTFILVDKFIVSLTLFLTKLEPMFEY